MSKPQMTDITDQLPRNAANQRKWLQTRYLSRIKEIVIHWSGPAVVADEMVQLQGDANYHIGKDWNPPYGVRGWAIMYHYAVGRSGRIYKLNPETDITWHASNGNPTGLGVHAILGQGQKPTPEMMSSLKALTDWLTQERPDIAAGGVNVWGHGEMGGVYGGGPAYGNSTSCPGPDLLAWVRAYRIGTPLPQPIPMPQPTPEPQVYLDELTGVRVTMGFLDYFKARGGVANLGRPLTKELSMMLEDGNSYTVQLFERRLLHWRPNEQIGEARLGYMWGKEKGLVA